MVGSGLDGLAARIETLEVRAEATELLARYCRSLDTRDRSLFDSVFHDDVRFRRTADGSFAQGRAALWDYIMAILTPMGPTLHTTTNSLEITRRDDGTIASTHLGFAEHSVDDELVVAALTYRHAYGRGTDGALRITTRVVDPWYFARADDLHHHYGTRRDHWWSGAPPETLPESSPSWRRFYAEASNGGAAGVDHA